MLFAFADYYIQTTLPWSSGRLSPGDCRLSKFHNNKGIDVTAEPPPLVSSWSSLSGWYCLNRLFADTKQFIMHDIKGIISINNTIIKK